MQILKFINFEILFAIKRKECCVRTKKKNTFVAEIVGGFHSCDDLGGKKGGKIA